MKRSKISLEARMILLSGRMKDNNKIMKKLKRQLRKYEK